MQNMPQLSEFNKSETTVAKSSEILSQIQQIQHIVKSVMQENKHYGVIAGTKNKTLYKAGAELLLQTFRLAPDYEILESIHEDDYIRYVVKCTIYSISSEKKVSTGLGSCSTSEAKYRYKWIPTNLKPGREEAEKLKTEGKGRWRKIGDSFIWHEKQYNDEIHDLDNTILKMASKRALIEATEHAIPASDTFTEGFDFSMKEEHEIPSAPFVNNIKEPDTHVFTNSQSKNIPPEKQKNAETNVSYKMKLHRLLVEKYGIKDKGEMVSFISQETGKEKLTEQEAMALYNDLFKFDADDVPF